MKSILVAAVLLVGCGEKQPEDPTSIDQCMRREIFFQCLAAVPKGPEKTKYNDWDEVIGECASSAQYLSLRKESVIKPECRL